MRKIFYFYKSFKLPIHVIDKDVFQVGKMYCRPHNQAWCPYQWPWCPRKYCYSLIFNLKGEGARCISGWISGLTITKGFCAPTNGLGALESTAILWYVMAFGDLGCPFKMALKWVPFILVKGLSNHTLSMFYTILHAYFVNFPPRGREGREEKKNCAQHALRGQGSNPGPTACYVRVPSCTPWRLFIQASLSVPVDRLRRLRHIMCSVFWR